MNKILIVGHPASGFKDVHALLHQCGMATPLPSRREGLSPQAITEALCRAYQLPIVGMLTDDREYAQIDVAPVWNGMALDLMLGNLEQPLWGWADPQAIYFLDYWKTLDSQLSFVLVYDEPRRALMEAARQHTQNVDCPSSQLQLRCLLDNWISYNEAILRFYLRHTERCLLVHGRQVGRATDRYFEQLQPLLDTPLSPDPAGEKLSSSGGGDQLFMSLSAPTIPDSALTGVGVELHEAAALLHAYSAERYLINDVLEHHPAILQLYAELQSVANLPFDAPAREAEGVAADAWQALLNQRRLVSRVISELQSEAQLAGEDADRNHQALQQEMTASAEAETRWQEREREILDQVNNLQGENELLLDQLHKVQEELERYYLQLKDTERAKEAVDKARVDARRETSALKWQLEAMQSTLQEELGRPPNLSIVPSRTLLSVLMRRLLRRVVPGPVLHRRALRQARSAEKLALEHELEQIRKSQWFDGDWYLATYADIKLSGTDPALHYHVHGWKEGRKPSPKFDTAYYLMAYPDVREANVNPLLHFIRNGAAEGRIPGGPSTG